MKSVRIAALSDYRIPLYFEFPMKGQSEEHAMKVLYFLWKAFLSLIKTDSF